MLQLEYIYFWPSWVIVYAVGVTTQWIIRFMRSMNYFELERSSRAVNVVFGHAFR